ncbi:MAG: hypothetical protein QMB24_12460 [Spirosomataceae bacterium]
METKNFAEMTDEELLVEKKKLKNSKITHAILIGFLAEILIVGITAWIFSPNKRVGFLIPMSIPAIFIYRMIKNSKNNRELEDTLKDRGLN